MGCLGLRCRSEVGEGRFFISGAGSCSFDVGITGIWIARTSTLRAKIDPVNS